MVFSVDTASFKTTLHLFCENAEKDDNDVEHGHQVPRGVAPAWPHLGGLLHAGPRRLLWGPDLGSKAPSPHTLGTRKLLWAPSFLTSLLSVFHKVSSQEGSG